MTSFSLGIDLGTTSVKVIALDGEGRVLASSSSHHGIEDTSEGVQADPETWWTSTLSALGGLRLDLTEAVAIGFSGNMSSLVLVDAQLRAVRPAMLLADSRGAEELSLLGDDVVGQIVAATGNIPETVFSLSSLLWLRDNAPEDLGAAAFWLSAKDFLRARLTGLAATEATDAYNSLLLKDGQWNTALITELDLPVDLFPPLLGSAAQAGTVSVAAARETSLPAGIPVATGAGDVAASIEGSGGLPRSALAVSLGTSVTLMASVDRRTLPPAALGKLTVHPTVTGSLFALGSLLTGGLALNWVRSRMGADVIAEVSSIPSESSEVVFLPYLAGTGSPDFEASARGTLLGITPTTTGTDITFALFEAIAFDLVDLVDLLEGEYTSVLVSGGGSNVLAWPQIIADVMGLPVQRLDAPDSSAAGAAVLGWAVLGHTVVAAAPGQQFSPREELSGAWKRRRRRYRRARDSALDYYLNNEAERKATP